MLGLSDDACSTHAHELTATRLALGRCTALSLAAVRNHEELVAAVSAARDSEHVDAAFATRLRDVKERRAEAGAAGSNVRHVITSHPATPRTGHGELSAQPRSIAARMPLPLIRTQALPFARRGVARPPSTTRLHS